MRSSAVFVLGGDDAASAQVVQSILGNAAQALQDLGGMLAEQRRRAAFTALHAVEPDWLFEHQRRHRLLENGRPIKTFWAELRDVQRLVLELLEIPASVYGG